ncbi:Ankyrin repeat domain-containing protein [Drosera capensis]
MSPKISPPPPPSPHTPTLDLSLYAHSPLHHAVITRSHSTLSRLLSTLPSLPPTPPTTVSSSLAAENLANSISASLDLRDNVPLRLTPLHLAVLLNDPVSVHLLSDAGADSSLQNSLGWSPLHDAIALRRREIAAVLLRNHHRASYEKWRRRLPRVVEGLRRMRDFYMEIGFRFESSVVPLIGKIAPSDTYKIWKRDGNLRADMTLAGFDGLKIQRSDQSFLFLGDGRADDGDVAAGSLIVLNHEERRVYDAFENAGAEMSEKEIAAAVGQSSVYRPGMDVTKAELAKCVNWRGKERTDVVGEEWKTKVYEIQNVSFSFRSRKACNADADVAGSEQVLPLELDEEAEEGYLVADLGDGRRHSSFVKSEREWVTVSRKSVDINLGSDRRRMVPDRVIVKETIPPPAVKDKEWVRNLKPMVWLTEDFPLKTEELLPLLDILANKVKAVRRLRELLTTKFPPGTFPVKISIPVIPTVKVVITFTKFVKLPPTDLFYTPLSSPRHLNNGQGDSSESNYKSCSSSSSSSSTSWLWRSSSRRITEKQQQQQHKQSSKGSSQSDPFEIPSGYTWTSINSMTDNKLKKSKSVRKSK